MNNLTKIMNGWRKYLNSSSKKEFLNEAFTSEGDDVYQGLATLTVDLSAKGKDAVLSDIRSITGVTIVSKRDKRRSGSLDISHISIKVDDSLLGLYSTKKIKKHIELTVNTKIEGVRNFAFIEDLTPVEDAK
jgi:hypothetical protein